MSANNYDPVAAAYSQHFKDELASKPFDRKMLDWLIEKTDTTLPICDMGCGPGQIARYLCDQGAKSCGIDLSCEMIRHARLLNPDIPFAVGDMLDLKDVQSEAFGGIAAFYSIVHFTPSLARQAFSELRRVLAPKGILLVTHHIGSEVLHLDELLGTAIDLDFRFFETRETKTLLQETGFALEEVIERDPYPDVEHQSRRAYIFARR